MIAKKNSRFDLERKRLVLFNLGLLGASAFTLAAFTYSEEVIIAQEKERVASQTIIYEAVEKEVQQPRQQTQTQQPQQQQNQQMGNENAISENVSAGQNTNNTGEAGLAGIGPQGVSLPNMGIVHIDLGEVIEIPKIDAAYIGGYNAMMEYIGEVQEYPEEDIWLGVQGTVFVSFVVEKDGKVSNVEIERGVSSTLDREAKRIVRSFPNWKPGEDEYGAVRTRVRLPIRFMLE